MATSSPSLLPTSSPLTSLSFNLPPELKSPIRLLAHDESVSLFSSPFSSISSDSEANTTIVPTQDFVARLNLLRDVGDDENNENNDDEKYADNDDKDDDHDKNDDGDKDGVENDGDGSDEGVARRATVSPLPLRQVARADLAVTGQSVVGRAGARAPPPLLRRPPNPTTKIDDLGIRVTDELLRKRHQEEEGTEVFGGSSLGPGGAALSCRLSPVSGQ